ncbi:hypothetical protein MAR_001818 [Mya arenaria]|uniref:RNase H type-1 domain-containing protein n=1 Tax=Mya arenaria TaxID=6604 RepID=A0ABY7FD14_MYAAR|nr:hypothetical protein MAR_001818 [Mya arenaria]
MQNFAHLKSDVDRLRKQMQEPCDESEDESSSMPTPDVADQASCSQPVTAAGIFEDIAAALSLSEAKGSPVSGPLASLTDKIIDKTMKDKKRNDLADKYPVSENVTKLNPPKVNPEIWRIIEAKTRLKDVKLQKIQQFTLRAIVPIMRVIDSLVAGRDCQESLNLDELVTKLVDAVALTAVGNADANVCRRESIKRDLNEEYQAICSNTNPVTQMLFGDNITDQLKSNKIGFKDNDRIHRVILKHRGGGDILEEYRTGDSPVRLPNNMPNINLNLQCRPKSNGSYRVILKLKSLNESIEYIHFKMESLHAAMYTAFNTWLFHGVNRLKDAYYTVNIYMTSKLLKPVFSCLRMKGFPSVVYLNDSYLQGTTYAECLENVSVTQELLADIGFVINNEKSLFIPTQELVFLGCILNSNNITISFTEQKMQTIKLAIQTLQNSAYYTIRQVAEIIGKMISYSKAIPYWILYTKVLEQDKTSALKYNKGNFDSHMTLSAESLIDLDWWLRAVKNSGAPLYRDIPVISLTTDASSKGWGQYVKITGGQWTIAEASFKDNINYLELNAVLLGLKAYTLCLREKHVRVRKDNPTAVAYINHMGGVPAQNNAMILHM